MGIFDSLIKSNKKDASKTIMPVLPKEIYEAATLELQDILAPSALKVSPKDLNLGDKITERISLFHIHDICQTTGLLQ
ncbi:MAG: conjugal transfer ATP-binding protein TraC [Patescibacteria group bacterium]|nr:conjugal transfer ATP-binding protein TraC [Patescibacteria group bacterium]